MAGFIPTGFVFHILQGCFTSCKATLTYLCLQSFNLHIGASLRIPTENARTTIPSSTQAQQEQHPITTRREAFVDPFEGLPLRRFADRVGEYIMPAFQAMQDDMRKAKRVAKVDVPVPTVEASNIPHFLPFTRWYAV